MADDVPEVETQAPKKPGKKRGRPPVVIDLAMLERIALLQPTYAELAHVFKTTERTIKKRMKDEQFRRAFELGKAGGTLNLKRLQWRHAQMANSAGVQMTIHLSKHWLGETDKAALELTGKVDSTVEVKSARDRVADKLDALSERIARRVAGIAAAAGAATVSGEPVGD